MIDLGDRLRVLQEVVPSQWPRVHRREGRGVVPASEELLETGAAAGRRIEQPVTVSVSLRVSILKHLLGHPSARTEITRQLQHPGPQ